MFLVHIATALKERGRASEAGGLLDCAKRTIAIQDGGPVFSGYYVPMYLAALRAQVLALEGNRAAALREMKRAYQLGFYTPLSSGLGFYPALDAFRSTPEYSALDAAFKRRTAAERAEVLRHSPSLR
jgi:hypothetical protein